MSGSGRKNEKDWFSLNKPKCSDILEIYCIPKQDGSLRYSQTYIRGAVNLFQGPNKHITGHPTNLCQGRNKNISGLQQIDIRGAASICIYVLTYIRVATNLYQGRKKLISWVQHTYIRGAPSMYLGRNKFISRVLQSCIRG